MNSVYFVLTIGRVSTHPANGFAKESIGMNSTFFRLPHALRISFSLPQ
jgi:hypothetical protein